MACGEIHQARRNDGNEAIKLLQNWLYYLAKKCNQEPIKKPADAGFFIYHFTKLTINNLA